MEGPRGEAALVLAVSEVRGPAHQVIAVLAQGKLDGEPFRKAWYKAIRSLAPPRVCTPELAAQIAEDREALAEIRPYLKAAYEDREPTRAEIAKARELASKSERLNGLREEVAA